MTRIKLLTIAKERVYWDETARQLLWKPGLDKRTRPDSPVLSEYIAVSGKHLSTYHVVWFLVTGQVIERASVLSRAHGDGTLKDWRVISRRDSILLGKNSAHRYKYRNWMDKLKDSHA